MVAGQLYVIENEYQKLLDGPRVVTPIIGAVNFVREKGDVWHLYEEFDESFVLKKSRGKRPYISGMKLCQYINRVSVTV